MSDNIADQAPEPVAEAVQVVGIRFPNSGKTYCFRAEGLDLRCGDRVVVESELGISIGEVVRKSFPCQVPQEELRSVLRKVTKADILQEQENETVKTEARIYGMERIKARGLDMKLMSTEVTLDRKRFIFYFTAENRIDFRELVKDLAGKFRTRIELRQVGVRDAAKMVGGLGVCGREFCCKSFLKSFAPISIKMAKQQDLVLNTAKLSGQCGRLMCCLHYEYDPTRPARKKARFGAPAEKEIREPEEIAAVEEVSEAPVETVPEAEPAAMTEEAGAGIKQGRDASSITNASPVKPRKSRRRGRGRKDRGQSEQSRDASQKQRPPHEPRPDRPKSERHKPERKPEGFRRDAQQRPERQTNETPERGEARDTDSRPPRPERPQGAPPQGERVEGPKGTGSAEGGAGDKLARKPRRRRPRGRRKNKPE